MHRHYRLLAPDTGDNPAVGTPPAGDPATLPQPQAGITPPEPPAGDGDTTISLEEARKLRSEAKALRERLKASDAKATELDKLKAEIEAAKLTEAERQAKEYADLQASNEDLAAALMEAHVNQDIARFASKFNFAIDADLIARLIDWKEVEWNEETGRPTNIEHLLEKLAKSAPNLVGRAAPTSGGATNPPRSATQSSEINDAYIASLTPQAYNQLSPEMRTRISQYLANRVTTGRR